MIIKAYLFLIVLSFIYNVKLSNKLKAKSFEYENYFNNNGNNFYESLSNIGNNYYGGNSYNYRTFTNKNTISEIFNPVILKTGNGISPQVGQKVKVHYNGTFLDGRKFDSSVDRGTPFEFTVGVGQVIKCWDQVVANLSVGEKVKVTCPSNLAYGSRGAGDAIPPNTDLNFEIELLSI